MACHRYIERNPVRAGMVPTAGDYRWSSHNGNTGRVCNALLTAHPEYLALSVDESSRHTAYEGLFATNDEPSFLAAIRDATQGGFALVGERVKHRLPESLQARLERKSPGPRPKPRSKANDRSREIELELGFRPRTS